VKHFLIAATPACLIGLGLIALVATHRPADNRQRPGNATARATDRGRSLAARAEQLIRDHTGDPGSVRVAFVRYS
jgi:hypothetical protein